MSIAAAERSIPVRRRLRWHHKSGIAIGVVVVALVALRIALPYWVLAEINRQMATLGPYRGHVADVDLHLWRGAYSLDDMVIEKRSGKVPVPLFKGTRVDLSVAWHPLFRGAVAAEVVSDAPETNLVDDRGDADSQNGRGVDWRAQLDRLLPIQLNEVSVRDGTVAFRAFATKRPVDLKPPDAQ